MLKALWYLSMAIFFVTLLFTYSALSDLVEINDELAMSVSRDNLFYLTLGFFIFSNLVCYLGAQVVLKLMARRDNFNNVDLASFAARFISWFFSLGFALNAFFICLMIFMNFQNRLDPTETNFYSFLVYLAPMFILASVFYLLFIFATRTRAA